MLDSIIENNTQYRGFCQYIIWLRISC